LVVVRPWRIIRQVGTDATVRRVRASVPKA
jgi:hypothetical protein